MPTLFSTRPVLLTAPYKRAAGSKRLWVDAFQYPDPADDYADVFSLLQFRQRAEEAFRGRR